LQIDQPDYGVKAFRSYPDADTVPACPPEFARNDHLDTNVLVGGIEAQADRKIPPAMRRSGVYGLGMTPVA
jgi:hypothetical protein